jgi:predicted nucleic acid-binding protein
LATEAVATLLGRGDDCYLAPQVLIELWVVATRPTEVNGLGWSPDYTRQVIEQLLDRFPLVEESPQIFPTWFNLVADHQIKGKRTHDARIIAAMHAANISHILTLNSNDFSAISDITIVGPQDIR